MNPSILTMQEEDKKEGIIINNWKNIPEKTGYWWTFSKEADKIYLGWVIIHDGLVFLYDFAKNVVNPIICFSDKNPQTLGLLFLEVEIPLKPNKGENQQ